jgi:hypothetical protein
MLGSEGAGMAWATDAGPEDAPQLPAAGVSSSHELGLLRLELMQFERQASDLLRYKIVATAVLGGAAIGVGPAVSTAVTWVLVLVPLVCLFVDALHIQADAAILTIARFLRRYPDNVLGEYELFVSGIRRGEKDLIVLHYLVLVATTVLLSLSVLVAGIWMLRSPDYGSIQATSTIVSGAVGVVLGGALHVMRLRRLKAIDG